ncbi:hypothetical protein, partial [Escherichia coli]|uniref:hypothetical protein n=1 Tax=Escherichia coli TaxID=562 RepID=UPI001952A0AA
SPQSSIALAMGSVPTVSGIYNVVAPEHVRNAEFIRAIGCAIGRPVFFPSIPKWVICRVFLE